MKKVASILGISAISLAVALAPAFAQQTNPKEPVNSATIQPKVDEKGKAAGKDEKSTPAKPGADMKTGTAAPSQVKPGTDVKAAPTAKPDSRSENIPAKPGGDIKAMNPSPRPVADIKSNAPSGKLETGVMKDDKAAPVKPGSDVKNMAPSHRPDADVKGNLGKTGTGVTQDDKAAPAVPKVQ